jgi:hypothetical protein
MPKPLRMIEEAFSARTNATAVRKAFEEGHRMEKALAASRQDRLVESDGAIVASSRRSTPSSCI